MRRSARGGVEPAPSPPVFFIDRGMGAHTLRAALEGLGARVESHQDHFEPDCDDAVWLTEVAGRRWVVLTKDVAIGKNPLEREAVRRSGCRVFAFNNSNLPGSAVAAGFVKAYPALVKWSARPGPFFAVVDREGRVTMRLDFHAERR